MSELYSGTLPSLLAFETVTESVCLCGTCSLELLYTKAEQMNHSCYTCFAKPRAFSFELCITLTLNGQPLKS